MTAMTRLDAPDTSILGTVNEVAKERLHRRSNKAQSGKVCMGMGIESVRMTTQNETAVQHFLGISIIQFARRVSSCTDTTKPPS